MKPVSLEKIIWSEDAQSFTQTGRKGQAESSSFLLEKTVGLQPVILVDNHDNLLAYIGAQFLPWDSDVLQKASARIGYLWSQGDYSTQKQRLSRLLNVCIKHLKNTHTLEFISARIRCEHLAAIHSVEDVGFRVIECYLTFYREMEQYMDVIKRDKRVRLACESQVEEVAKLAYDAFRYNRYMIDPMIPEQQARHSRLVWVKNAFTGRAEAIYVAEINQEVAGFVILRTVERENNKKTGLIDLIAIDPEYAGQGIGSALVRQAFDYYQDKVEMVEVGTQAANFAAVNLYQKMGFHFLHSEYSFHWHSSLYR